MTCCWSELLERGAGVCCGFPGSDVGRDRQKLQPIVLCSVLENLSGDLQAVFGAKTARKMTSGALVSFEMFSP